jgi:hypothetical protein
VSTFLHVLGRIGGDVGKVILGVAPLIPGPVGTVAGAFSGVIKAELNTGATNTEKKDAAVATAMTNTPVHPDKIAIISDIVEAALTIMKSLALLFPGPTTPAPPAAPVVVASK